MSIQYDGMLNLLRTTLPKYLSQTKLGWVNDFVPRTFLVGKLLRRAKASEDGGLNITFDVDLEAGAQPQWVGPYEELSFATTTPPQRGSVPWRFLQHAWTKSLHEIDLNKGDKVVVIDLLQQAKEKINTSAVAMLEDTFMAKDGNQDHDEGGAQFLKPLGLRYWGTIDGLHITGSTSRTVGGINPNTYANWKNEYINPYTSSDMGTTGKITSIRDLPTAFERMAARMRFEAIDVWGNLAKDVKHADTMDPDGKQSPDDLLIVQDYRSNILLRDIFFDNRDDVSRDNQFRGRPTWKGIPVDWDQNLGLGTYGYAKDSAGNTLWTHSDTTNYVAGNWVNGGESYFVNTKYARMMVHNKHMPFIKDPYIPQGRFQLAFEWDFWTQLMFRSRRRGIGAIIGYSTTI